ncbi:hypothetical protein [Halopenitus persicus]|uniref:hypothetical protein n=1 Tax=Halopenitus persicus TaxID=1048396 RepID=UPI000BBAEDEF|nr:hypothetical protein [Halopenitus persicus]
MAYRLVRARPNHDRLPELRDRLDDGEIEPMEPFGRALTAALERAKFDPESGEAVWIEEDYCTPPLAMEREAVLDEYFEDVTVVSEDVDETAGWKRLEDLPEFWEQLSNVQ